MNRAALMLSLSIAAATFQAIAADNAEIKINWNETHQTIVGFGGTMGWIHPNPKQREAIFDLLFKELGASFLRVQGLCGEDGDESTPEPADKAGDLKTIDWSKFKFSETEKKSAANIKSAMERGVKTIVPVTWSPPGWMKSNGSRSGIGGEFKAAMTDKFAELWTAYVLAMKRDFDIDIQYLSIQNEPDLTYYYPTCGYPPEKYAAVVAAVRERLEKEKLSVRVLGPDVCRIYNLSNYLSAMDKKNSSPGTPALTHLYDLYIPFERVEKDAERWRSARDSAAKYNRSLWLMETSNVFSNTEAASYDEAIIWAQKMHWALVEGDCAVVCYWQLFFDKKSEALIYCKKSEDEKYEITPKFYTSMNFYKFVRPGMERASATSSDKDVLVSAFRTAHGDAGDRAIVLINASVHARTVSYAADDAAWKRYLTDATHNCIPVADLKNAKNLELPPQSVTTLVKIVQP